MKGYSYVRFSVSPKKISMRFFGCHALDGVFVIGSRGYNTHPDRLGLEIYGWRSRLRRGTSPDTTIAPDPRGQPSAGSAIRISSRFSLQVARLRITSSRLQRCGPFFVVHLHYQALRDDGAVVYINGISVAQQHAGGADKRLYPARSSVDGDAETRYFETFSVIPYSHLVRGTNVVAVEMHQGDSSHSDVGFDLGLIANQAPDPARGQRSSPR